MQRSDVRPGHAPVENGYRKLTDQDKGIVSMEQDEKKIYTLQIIVTNYCNLDCKYCYIRKGEHKIISLSTVQNAITEMLSQYPADGWRYFLCFMGGEPLLAFERIKEICEWIWRTYPDLDIQISSPTNGSLLNEKMRQWFRENHRRFSLGLSYDGDSAQNENRSNSRDFIELDFFRELWPEQPIKMTISEKAVDRLAKDIIKLQKEGILVTANVACGEPEWRKESVIEFGNQMIFLADYYSTHHEIPLVDLIDIDIRRALLFEEPMKQCCGIGKNYDTIDLDGKKYPCHMFSSLALTDKEIKDSLGYNIGSRTEYQVWDCVKCVLNPICPRCYGLSYKRSGDPFHIDVNICKLFKQQVRGACSFHIKRMSKKSELDTVDHQLLVAIKTILFNIGQIP